jgi:hypothetical protein
VGSYDPETLGFSSQIDAHCLHIKQDAHRLLYPTEGCISIQHLVDSIFGRLKTSMYALDRGDFVKIEVLTHVLCSSLDHCKIV